MSVSTLSRTRRGFTLVELLVVITVIAILASMVVPAISMVKELANKAKCGKNQSGIYAALTAYQEGGDPGWPNARWKVSGGAAATSTSSAIAEPNQQAGYTAAIFEILAAHLRDSLPIVVFKCPSQTAPNFSPNPNLQPSATRAGFEWGWGEYKLPYSMDWAAPADAGASRPLIADRDVVNHKDKQAVSCYADGHYTTLDRNKKGTVGGKISVGYGDTASSEGGGTPETVFVENPNGKGREDRTDDDAPLTEADRDNIYDDNGDATTRRPQAPTIPGSGSGRRAFMK